MPKWSILLFITTLKSFPLAEPAASKPKIRQAKTSAEQNVDGSQISIATKAQLVRLGCGPSLNLATAIEACGQCGFDMRRHEGRDVAIERRNLFHET